MPSTGLAGYQEAFVPGQSLPKESRTPASNALGLDLEPGSGVLSLASRR